MIPIRRYWNLLRRYLRPMRARMFLLALLVTAVIGLQLAAPQVVARFIDEAVAQAPSSTLIKLALLFVGLALAQQALGVVSTWLAQVVGWTATNELRADLAAHCLDLDLGFHKAHTPGELIERIDGDVTALSNFFSQFVVHVAGSVALLIGILIALTAENVWIGLVMTLFAGLALAAMARIQAMAVPWWREMRQRSAEFFGFLGEILGGTEDIRSGGSAPFFRRRVTEILRRWLPDELRAARGWAAMWSTNVVVFALGMSLVYWLGSRFFGSGQLTIGSVYLVFAYVELLRMPMERIQDQMEDLQKAGAGIERVEELLATQTKVPELALFDLPPGALSVELDRVTFAYDDDDDDRPVLCELSFELAPGRVLGVLGRTGSGKTTIARLVTRLYDPVEGDVRVGGVSVREVAGDRLRARVGMVSQDVQLFGASLRDNLTLFDSRVSDTHIMEVLFHLGLADWVLGLPEGLDTPLAAGGGGLSAGEAQLLAFARVFLADPGLVVLDEASSRLDPGTEQLIERAVDHLFAGRTGILIAHRLATLERADEVLIMEDGRVVERGDRVALATDQGSRYAHYLRVGMEEVLA